MTSEEYGQYIDDFELGADVMPGESLTDYIERRRREFDSKADGGVIGIEVKIADEMAKGGRVGLFSGGALKGLASLFKSGKDKIDDIIETKAMEKVGFRSKDDIPLSTYSEMKGPIKLSDMEKIPEDQLKKILRTQELGLYEETPELLKAANLLQRFTKKVGGKRVIDYERAEDILGIKLKGNETLDELFKIEFQTRPENRLTDSPFKDFEEYVLKGEKKADGGRVGLFMGGPPLTGQALSIYNSMNAYGFSDQEIADALRARGLYDAAPAVTTPVINTAPNIINRGGGGGGGEGGPTGPTYSRDDDLGTSDYQGTGPGLLEGLLSIPGNLFQAYVKNSPAINFAKQIFKPKFERINKINIDAVVRAEEERKAKAAAERAAFLAEQQRTGIANQLGGPDGQSGGKYAGGASFASANPYGGSGTMNDLGADNFKKGGLATMFTRRR